METSGVIGAVHHRGIAVDDIGEAKRQYTSSCAAHLFGSANALTNYNISSSVAGEFAKKKADNKIN